MKVDRMKEEFDKTAEIASQMSLDLLEMVKGLKKKQMERVFMAVMEYPTPNTRELISQDEIDVAQLGIGLKETQMKLGFLNMAMKEAEKLEEESEN